MSQPKMEWLPKDQWEAPRVAAGGDDLSGKAPLAGLFSGFWPSPCLLSDGAGADPASVLVSEPAGCSVQSAELSDEVELLNMSVTPGLVSPASDLSDRSAQAGRPELDPCEMGNSHGRGTQAIELYLGSDTQQGVGLPGGTKAEHEEDQSGSKSDARRSGGGEYGGHPDDLADQRARQPSRVENRDRSRSRDSDDRRRRHKDEDRYEQSRSRERSFTQAGSLQAKHSGRDRQQSISRSRSVCKRDGRWPFRRGRIIPCSTKMSVDMLGNLRFGSDHKEDLEGLSPSTALFLWNYEKQKLHGIFAGTSRPIEDTSKHVDYLYEVRVRNYAEYSSLPKEMALRLVPRDGKTRRGETLLKPYLDADHVDRLCSAFAK